MKRLYKCLCSWMMILIMAVSVIQVPQSAKMVYAETISLSNPRIVKDSGMISGQKVTWDLITFGSYPQSEVTSGDAVYEKLVAATEWDGKQEIIIDGNKYRRMLKSDATFVPDYESPCYYQWEDETTYHYFLYEPIEWRVLHVDDNKALVLSDMVLDNEELYASDWAGVWEESQVRSWLNGYGSDSNKDAIDYADNNFINSAFTVEEQTTIIQYTEEDIEDAYVGSGMEDDTTDKLFLLSVTEVYLNEEAEAYGFVRDKNVYDEAKWCHSSDYAKAQGIFNSDSTNYAENCMWWLRKGSGTSHAGFVYDSGKVESTGRYTDSNIGIRVALTLDLSKEALYAYEGTICSEEYKIPVESSGEKIEGELCNPRIEPDTSAMTGRKATWDCVWFGAYPQTEVTAEEAVYEELEKAADWDENGDITVDGVKYRRILQSDSRATSFNTTNPDSLTNYYWSDDTTYHYFRYEPIKWRILNIEGEQAYILADVVLDYRVFGGSASANCAWEYSAVRSWLNGYSASSNWLKVDYTNNNFLSLAFEDYEEEAIVTTTVTHLDNFYDGAAGGDDTTDKIHFLAESEVYETQTSMNYGFGAAFSVADESRSAKCTTFAKAMGLVSGETGKTDFWLRSSALYGNNAMRVEESGEVDNIGVSHKNLSGIRPTLYLNLSRESAYAYAGEICSDGTVSEVEYTGTGAGAANGGLHNPAVTIDSSLKAGKKITWDSITFGSYPQSEVTSEDSVYSTLTGAVGWDENNEITIEGVRYRRMVSGNATYAREEYPVRGYYQWEDNTTYHYFVYEPIQWRVLRVDNGHALLLSDIVLDGQRYDISREVGWADSGLRKWLNGEGETYQDVGFINSAFSQEEKDAILPYNESDACDGTEETGAITDKIYLLSGADLSGGTKADKYGFVNGVTGIADEARRCHSSDYAKAQGVFSVSSSTYKDNCIWWVRGTGTFTKGIETIADNGSLTYQDPTKKNIGVRVALNLDLSATDIYSYAGTVCSTDNIEKIKNSDEKTEDILSNPRMMNDYSTVSGKVTTWDCVWYGSYPQTEITSGDSVYAALETATEWDEYDDTIVGSNKYRRLSDGETYRYFIYEPIKWRVLQVDDEEMFLLADKALDIRGMDMDYTTQSWDRSTLRSWLNGKDAIQNRAEIDFTNNSFIGAAFTVGEQEYIVNSQVNRSTSMYQVESEQEIGKNTLDHIFILSDQDVYGTDEAESYGFDGSFKVRDEARRCQGTGYAQAKGLSAYSDSGEPGHVAWWIRTLGESQGYVANVPDWGYVDVAGSKGECGIRPAMYVSLSDNELYSYAGVVCSDGTETEVGGTGKDDDTQEGEIEDGNDDGDEGEGQDTTEEPEGGDTTEEEESGGDDIPNEETTEDTTEKDDESGTNDSENPTDDNESGGIGGTDKDNESDGEDGNSDSDEPGGDSPKDDNSEIRKDVNHVTIAAVPAQIYCGEAVTPTVAITHGTNKLAQGKDYTVSYKNNTDVGNAQVTVQGCGDYSGTKVITFRIQPFDVSNLSPILKGRDGKIYRAVYKNKKIQLKTTFRIASTNNGKKVYLEPKEGVDYTLRYKNNKKVGTASIIYTFKGNYTGTLTKNFQIVPPATKITGIRKSGSSLIVQWKKVSSCDRYEVYRATSKKGKYKKIATVKGKKKCTYKDRKVKKGKKYYYKVKACKKVKGQIYKSDFSNTKKGKR